MMEKYSCGRSNMIRVEHDPRWLQVKQTMGRLLFLGESRTMEKDSYGRLNNDRDHQGHTRPKSVTDQFITCFCIYKSSLMYIIIRLYATSIQFDCEIKMVIS